MFSGNHESRFRGGYTSITFRQEEKMGQRGIVKRGDSKMVVYEFYRRVPDGEDRLIGVLPERRKLPISRS